MPVKYRSVVTTTLLSLVLTTPLYGDDILDFLPAILQGSTASPRITDTQGNQCTLSENQKLMLQLHNNARRNGRNCGGINYAPAPALAWNCTIARTARSHSIEMQASGDLSHTGNDGSSAGQRLSRAGYRWRRWGENIAAGNTDAGRTMNQWLGSPPHCANLMNPAFREIGVASDNAVGNFWTTVFGSRN